MTAGTPPGNDLTKSVPDSKSPKSEKKSDHRPTAVKNTKATIVEKELSMEEKLALLRNKFKG